MYALFALLAGFIADIFRRYVSQYVVTILLLASGIALLVSAILGFIAAFNTVISTIQATMPSIALMAWSWVMPSNASACFSAIVFSYITRFLFDRYKEMILTKTIVAANAAKG